MRSIGGGAFAGRITAVGRGGQAGDKMTSRCLRRAIRTVTAPRTSCLLSSTFSKVGETNYEKFTRKRPRSTDVVIFDGEHLSRDKDGKIAEKVTVYSHGPYLVRPRLNAPPLPARRGGSWAVRWAVRSIGCGLCLNEAAPAWVPCMDSLQ